MKVKVRFFASLKEQFGQDSLEVNSAFSPATVGGLRAHLCAQYPGFAKAVSECRAFACSGEPRHGRSPTAHREAETAKAHRG